MSASPPRRVVPGGSASGALRAVAAAATAPSDPNALVTGVLQSVVDSGWADRCATWRRVGGAWRLIGYAGFDPSVLPLLAGAWGHAGTLEACLQEQEPAWGPGGEGAPVTGLLEGLGDQGLAIAPVRSANSVVLVSWAAREPAASDAGTLVGIAGLLDASWQAVELRRHLDATTEALGVLLGSVNQPLIVTDYTGRVRQMNPPARRLLRLPGDRIGMDVRDLLPGFAVDDESWTGSARTADGAKVSVDVTSRDFVRNDPDRARLHLLSQRVEDVERRRILSELATVDVASGLPNRRGLLEAVDREVALAKRYDAPAALLVVEVQGASPLSDATFRALGEAILRQTRRSDCVARVGPAELGILVSRGTRPQARGLCEKIIDLVKATSALVAGPGVQLGAMVGVACYPDHGESPAELFNSAVSAAIQAGQAGRSWAFFDAASAQVAAVLGGGAPPEAPAPLAVTAASPAVTAASSAASPGPPPRSAAPAVPADREPLPADAVSGSVLGGLVFVGSAVSGDYVADPFAAGPAAAPEPAAPPPAPAAPPPDPDATPSGAYAIPVLPDLPDLAQPRERSPAPRVAAPEPEPLKLAGDPDSTQSGAYRSARAPSGPPREWGGAGQILDEDDGLLLAVGGDDDEGEE